MLGYCGYIMSSLNAMVPFIVAGVSVDDMIVIEDFFNKAEGKSLRMGETMRAAGVAITITSVTSIVAFLSGAWLDMPGVASFCMTCAFAFTWDFFLNVTLFPALIVLDQRRIDAKKHFLCPCIITVDDFEFKGKGEERAENARRLTADWTGTDNPAARPISRSVCDRDSTFDRSTFVDIAAEKTTFAELSVEAFMNNKFGPFLTNRGVQAAVLIVSVGMSCMCGYVSQFTPTGIDIKNVVPDDSYITTYVEKVEKYWSGNGIRPVSIVVKYLDFSSEAEVAKLDTFFAWIEDQEYTPGPVGGAGGHWYKEYKVRKRGAKRDRASDKCSASKTLLKQAAPRELLSSLATLFPFL